MYLNEDVGAFAHGYQRENIPRLLCKGSRIKRSHVDVLPGIDIGLTISFALMKREHV